MLTDRRNVVVIADEVHRCQFGFKARIEKSGEIACGFANHLRDALPNASCTDFWEERLTAGHLCIRQPEEITHASVSLRSLNYARNASSMGHGLRRPPSLAQDPSLWHCPERADQAGSGSK